MALTVLPNGLLASGSGDKTIKMWNVQSGACEKTLSGCTDIVWALAVLPNGRLANGSGDGTIKVWNVQSGAREKTLSGHTSVVSALTVLPNGHLASGSFDMTIKVWNVATGSCAATLSGHTNSVYVLTILPNGRFASGSGDMRIKIWNVATKTCEATLSGHTSNVLALTALPNGSLVSGSADKTVMIWNVATKTCDATLSGHTSYVNALTVLPNWRLASGSADKTIKIWNLNSRLCESTTLSGHTNPVCALTLLPDGRLASGSDDNTIKVWDLGFRPILAPVSAPSAAVQAGSSEKAIVSRKEVTPFAQPQVAKEDLIQTTPPKSATTKSTSEGSARDGLFRFDGLSLSPIAGTISFDDLEIGRKLGQGGFGVVNEALWQGATQVAVKQLLGQLDQDLMDEFQRETNVHARLRHPNIILLYGICIEPLKVAMVMEFMARGSLYDVLKNPAELPWSLRLSMALDLASGLLYLHTQHIIHRDLKSLNILIDDRMRAKVSDFGLSKIKLTSASMTKGGGGTPHWMAPELFDEAANTPATDVYATGIVFWEIAARKLPYEGKNQMQIGRFIEKGNRETIPAETPSQFAALMTRCWAQRAEDRPDMREVTRELRASGSASEKASSGPASPVKPAAVDSGYAAFSKRPG